MIGCSAFLSLHVPTRVAVLVSLLTFAIIASAAVVPFVPDNTPAAALPPVIPTIAAPNGVIFDLTAANMGTQIPALGNLMAGDVPLTGGPCAGFITGEICGTNENAVAGLRLWQTVIQNQTAGQERFVAGFFAPGLAAWVPLVLNPNDWVQISTVYGGPTQPLWGVFSALPFQIVMTTSIIDPPSFSDFAICSSDASCTLQFTPPTDSGPLLGDTDAVPEPSAFFLMALGLAALYWQPRPRRGGVPG